MMHPATAGGFDDLAADYSRFRIGYSSELFDVLASQGFARGSNVLDAGCGTGLATQQLVTRGLRVTGIDPSGPMLAAARAAVPQATFVEGRVEALPFADGSFDGAVSAQAFHWFDADRAFAELLRVVKPGAPVAVWWKILGTTDPMRDLRARAAREAGVEPARDALSGGFGAFYRAPLSRRVTRVLPFVARFSVDDWLGYERSRAMARDAYGSQQTAYLAALAAGLRAKHNSPAARIDIRYTQFLYIGAAAP